MASIDTLKLVPCVSGTPPSPEVGTAPRSKGFIILKSSQSFLKSRHCSHSERLPTWRQAFERHCGCCWRCSTVDFKVRGKSDYRQRWKRCGSVTTVCCTVCRVESGDTCNDHTCMDYDFMSVPGVYTLHVATESDVCAQGEREEPRSPLNPC